MIIELRRVSNASGRRLSELEARENLLFAAVSWVVKARSSDPTRLILQYLYVDGKRLVCTDGRRLHASVELDTGKLVPGLYRVLKTGGVIWLDAMPPDTGVYPNYKQVFPDKGAYGGPVKIKYSRKHHGLFLMAVAIHKASGAVMNLEYVQDAIPAGDYADVSIDSEGSDGHHPVTITSNLGVAVVMPCRADV